MASKGGQIGYMMDTAKKYVLKHAGLSEAQFDKGGYTIRTTFDAKKTAQLEGAVKKVDKRYIDPEKRAQGQIRPVRWRLRGAGRRQDRRPVRR